MIHLSRQLHVEIHHGTFSYILGSYLGFAKKLCTMHQKIDQRTEVAALPVLGLRTLAGWRLSGFHGLTTHVFLMRSL